MSDIVDSIIGTIGNVFGDIFGAKQQSKNVDKQIEAQRKENVLARAHNIHLANMQNQENLAQWKRETEYNSPAAQMGRFQAAGLNPNLIYGQSNTAPQLSGSMTSGAPATPADMSALGNKPSVLASVFRSLGDGLMNIPLYREQVRGMKLDNDLKKQDIIGKQSDNAFNEWLRTVDPYSNSDSPFAKSIAGRRAWMEFHSVMTDNDLKDLQLSMSTFEHQMNQKSADYLLRKLAAEVNITEEEAKNFAVKLASEIGILRADERIKTAESFLVNPDFMKKLEGSGWQWATTFSNFIKTIANPFK